MKYAFHESAYMIVTSGNSFLKISNLVCRIPLWIIMAPFTIEEHPDLSRWLMGHDVTSTGRQPTGGNPWTTMFFAPVFISVWVAIYMLVIMALFEGLIMMKAKKKFNYDFMVTNV